MLYETAIQVQQTDFSRPEAQTVVDQLKQVLLFFDEHADSEDRFILPHLRIHNGQFVDELEEEHELDHRLTQTLFGHIQEWQTSTSSSQREVIGQRLSVAFSEFIAINLCHMNREETSCSTYCGSIIPMPKSGKCRVRFYSRCHPRRYWPKVAG